MVSRKAFRPGCSIAQSVGPGRDLGGPVNLRVLACALARPVCWLVFVPVF